MALKETARKKKNSKSMEKKKDSSPNIICIDFPQEGEAVNPGHYAVRIASDPNAAVEVSINGSDWMGCRTADGFFWYDWWPSEPGKYSIVSRAKVGESPWKKSKKRSCCLPSTN